MLRKENNHEQARLADHPRCSAARSHGRHGSGPAISSQTDPPGGGTDTISRPFVRKMAENIGQQVLIDNRGGAGGNIGMEVAARAVPDGYTVVMGLTAQRSSR
jgi:hypothetical protein